MNFKIEKNTISLVLAIIMLLALLNSAYFFLVMLKLDIVRWLAFNACSLAIMVYLLCFVIHRVTKNDYLPAVPLLPLYYYGTMGLFIMPWDAAGMFAQLTHIIITLTVIWIVYGFLKERKYEALGRGLLLAVFIFVPVFAIIQAYSQVHMNEFMEALHNM